MKLYKVEVTFETVVLAEDIKAAEREAIWAIKEDDEAQEIYATQILDENDLPAGWDIKCIPWGGGYNVTQKTIGQILNNE